MVDTEAIRERIRIHFGAPVANGTDLVAHVTARMEQFLPGTHDLAVLRRDLRDIIYMSLYHTTDPSVNVTPNRRSRRFSEKEIDDAADELTGLLIERLRVCEFFYVSIRAFFLKTGSTQALRILREKYGAFLKEGEAELLEQIAGENSFM